MIDQFTYPQGDIQTWDESFGEDVSNDIPDAIREIIKLGKNELHFTLWKPPQSKLMQERAMMIGGLIPPNEEHLNPIKRTVPRVRDKISGFSFCATNPLKINFESLLEEDAELLNAAYARLHLHIREQHKIAEILKDEEGMYEMFRFPIKEYEANSIENIEDILSEIYTSVSRNRRVKRLWLRGQRKEYKFVRAQKVLDILPYGSIGNDFPSLVPSLGRFALRNPGEVNFGYAFSGPNHWWKKPFLNWVIRQNPQWLDGYPEFRSRLDASLADEDDMIFSEILVDMVIDPRVPTEIDDLRQWFFSNYKYSAWIWVLQQYGYLASMLDITEDVNSALFFTQAQMIDGRFKLPPPGDERVIYVFVEWEQSCAFRDISSIDWGDSDWARQLPPRVERQRAGCLIGSTWFRQNYYGYLVIARIRLNSGTCFTDLSIEDIFPNPDQDLLLKTLLEAKPTPEGLYW